MSSPLESPVIRYGIGIISASIAALVAFAFVDGTIRWVILGVAAIDLVVTPQILRLAVENNAGGREQAS